MADESFEIAWRKRQIAERQRLLPLAQNGDATAQFDLACSLDFQPPKDRRRAFRWYRRAAEAGHAEAQNFLAEILRDKRDRQSLREAAQWFRRAAELGDSSAQLSLGVALFYGNGVPKNEVEALSWYRRAAKQGCGKACHNIGHMYRWGDVVTRSRRQAYSWYRKAIELKNFLTYQSIYFLWCDAPKNDQLAMKWLRKGAAANDVRCLCKLGDRYRKGDGVSKSPSTAYQLYRQAADRGSDWAAYMVGRCFRDGIGVQRDIREAKRWLTKAARGKVKPANPALERLANL
jgi:uncharacterized protein